jgi:chromosome segregation ATPase
VAVRFGVRPKIQGERLNPRVDWANNLPVSEAKETRMSDQPPALSRSLFGYRRSAVNQMISDRDVMLRQAEGRVRAAEAKAKRLESDMANLQESNAGLEEQLQQVQARVQGGEGTSGSDITSRFINEELATILGAAEESATRIIERARTSTQQQVAEAERVWREAQDQITRFASWQDKIDPVLWTAQTKIEEVRTRIEEVPDQIRQALSPLAEAVASVDGDLMELSGASSQSRILAPGELEATEAGETEPELTAER